jgi:proteasome accessory factor B|tara:strand:- start:67885 stop:68808 length:924 start_codon:yes stop_codon:yes gene_type:complete
VKKLERLLNLVAAMLATEQPLSRQDLRRRLPDGAYSDNSESFRRAFERDKEELRSMGLPLSVEPVPGTDPPVDGYRIRPGDYEADMPALTADELAALHLASNLVRLRDAPRSDPFWRLGGVLQTDSPEVGAVAEVPAGEAVRELMTATAERRIVAFGYNGRNRTVEPHSLVFTRGRWYLAGHDQGPAESRQFRVDRIAGPVSAGEAGGFARPEDPVEVNVEPAWRYGEDGPLLASLLVHRRNVPWIVDFLGEDAVQERREDGSAVVVETVRNREAFRSFVLTFLDGAELLGPDELRTDMVTWLEALR